MGANEPGRTSTVLLPPSSGDNAGKSGVNWSGFLQPGTVTTFAGAFLLVGIGLVDNWIFQSSLVGHGSLSDLTLVLVGAAALLGHNPLQTASGA